MKKQLVPFLAGILLALPLLFAPLVAEAMSSTAITYQGKLVQNGEPVESAVNLAFRLYGAESGGSQIGETVFATDVAVNGGVFTVQLDFGTGAFTGADRWLEIDVGQTPLSPRQPLTPAPMAHFARNAASIPGAASFNLVGNDAVYTQGNVRIGSNTTPAMLTVAGTFASGRGSHASGLYSFAGGGWGNRASGMDSFVGAGMDNVASGFESFVGGGFFNTASEEKSFVGGGSLNIASGEDSFVGGGSGNIASGYRSFVGSGLNNTASGSGGFVGGGGGNVASGVSSFVAGGENSASGFLSFAAGYRAKAVHDGTFVWADTENSDFETTAENQFLIRARGGVGIGAAPVRDLHIRQQSTDVSAAGIQLETDPSNAWAVHVSNAGNLVIRYNNEFKARIDPADGAYLQVSDSRAKNSVQSLEGVLDKVFALRPASYYLNSDGQRASRSLGFIAQELKVLFPEVVSERDGAYSINYAGISVLNTAALIEINKRYDTRLRDQWEQYHELETRYEVMKEEKQRLAKHVHSIEERLTRLEASNPYSGPIE